jgi:hypothetical protein
MHIEKQYLKRYVVDEEKKFKVKMNTPPLGGVGKFKL